MQGKKIDLGLDSKILYLKFLLKAEIDSGISATHTHTHMHFYRRDLQFGPLRTT